MGDTVLMTPALGALRQALPEAELHAVLAEELVELLDGHPYVDQVLPLGNRGFGKISLARRLRRIGFDAVINFHGGPTSAWLTAAARAPLRVGRDSYRFGFLYNLRVKPPEDVFNDPDAIHTVHDQASLVSALGVPVEDFSPRLRVFPEARSRVLQRLAAIDVPASDYIVLQPTATFPSKQWPAERFLKLGRDLRKKTGHPVLVSLPEPVSGTSSHSVAELFSSELPVVSGLTPAEVIAFLESARLYVGNDSGPMHIAAALSIPVVGIFGSSNPRRWHPWGARHRTLSAGLDCSPCHGKWCTNPAEFACLDELPIETVYDACLDLLSQPPITTEAGDQTRGQK